jgi:hypothetical protein
MFVETNKNMGLMGAIKKVKEAVKKVTKKGEIVTTEKQEINVIKKVAKINVGDPILGMGVDFYPSEAVVDNFRINYKKADGVIKELMGSTVMVIVNMADGVTRGFICKYALDETLDNKVENSWKEK